jgi:hypothetical protein
MRNCIFATIWAALTFGVVGGGAAQDRSPQDELVTQFIEAIPPGTTTNVETYDTNGFRVESSQNRELGADLTANGNQFQVLSASASGMFRAIVEKGRPMSTGGGLAIFHRDSGQPMLAAEDSDGDGSLDGVTYAKMDKDGNVLVNVTDYEADGQPDVRINFADRFVELWHEDRWYRVQDRDGRRGIVLNGDFVELTTQKNRLIVP